MNQAQKARKVSKRFSILLLLSLFALFPILSPKGAAYAGVIITNIKIRKNFPIFEKDLQRVINIRVGEEYDKDLTKKVAHRIEMIYKDEGYQNAIVETRIKTVGEEEAEGTLIFVINKGKRIRIERVNIIDDRPEERPDIKSVLGINPGHVFKPKRLKERLDKLKKLLIYQGYLKADIRYLGTPGEGGISLDIYVYRGFRVNVRIQGNKHLHTGRIKDAMTFYENRFFDDWEVEESIKGIKELYREEGFLDAHIEAEMGQDKDKRGDRSITFKINEGKRICLKDVVFKNNKHFKKKKLKRQLLSMRSLSLFRTRPYKALTFTEDLKAIEALYQSEGFLNATISEDTEIAGKGCIRKILTIDEGLRFWVGKVEFIGNAAFTDKELEDILEVSGGTPFYPKKFQEDRRKLGIFYGNNGYPYAKITVDHHRDEEKGVVTISYSIEEGSLVKFGKTITKRNFKTRNKVIGLACAFRPGEPFSYQKILDSQERLLNLGLFRSLNIVPIGLDDTKEVVDTLVEVEEMKTGQVNFGAGFSSRAGYRGYLEIREDNLRGRGFIGGFRADFSGFGKHYNPVDEIERISKYTILFKDPLFISKHRIEGEGKIYHMIENRREYYARSNGLNLSLWRTYKRKNLRIGLTYHIDLNRLKDITVDPDEIPKEYTISAIGPTIIYDSRDNFMDPSRGIYTNINLDRAGGWIGGDKDFYRFQGEGRLFLPLTRKLTLALSIRGGYIGLYGRTGEVPIQELFFAGGSNTVRGFKEDSLGPFDKDTRLPLGGRMFWINNIELRYPLYRSIKGILFFDSGEVWEKKDDIDFSHLRRASGIGIRWLTPIGPLRFDYGIPINRREWEPKGRAYISIGHAF